MVNSAEPIQRDGSTVNTAWTIISNLIAGIILYGGIGWLLSLWLGHRAVFVAGGVLIGTALSLYLVHVRTSQEAGEPPGKR